MTATALGALVAIPRFYGLSSTSGANFTFDTSTDVLAVIFRIPATGTISNVHFRVATVTSPVMTHRIELRTVDNTTGKPNAAGTLYGSSTTITKDASTYTANTNVTAAVNATAASIGEEVALVFDLSAFTSGSFTQVQRKGGSPPTSIYPYQMTNTSGSDTLGGLATDGFALEYGTDTYYQIPGIDAVVSPVFATATVTNSGVTRRGNRFQPTVPMRAMGINITGDLDNDCFLRLRLQSDDSLLATATVDSSNRGATTGGESNYLFDAGATASMTAGTDYYILLEGNSASTATIYQITGIPETAQLGSLPGGANCFGTSYNAGYTDVNTSRYSIGVIVDTFDNGAGGSGGGTLARLPSGVSAVG